VIERPSRKALTNWSVHNPTLWVVLQSSSRIFFHSLYPVQEVTSVELASQFQDFMSSLKNQSAYCLLKLRVGDIEFKVRLLSADGAVQNVRLAASSMDGAWLKPTCYHEKPDPVSGGVWLSPCYKQEVVCCLHLHWYRVHRTAPARSSFEYASRRYRGEVRLFSADWAVQNVCL
jgi:hypothetical protein